MPTVEHWKRLDRWIETRRTLDRVLPAIPVTSFIVLMWVTRNMSIDSSGERGSLAFVCILMSMFGVSFIAFSARGFRPNRPPLPRWETPVLVAFILNWLFLGFGVLLPVLAIFLIVFRSAA